MFHLVALLAKRKGAVSALRFGKFEREIKGIIAPDHQLIQSQLFLFSLLGQGQDDENDAKNENENEETDETP